jgi:hypothetical protein
MLHLLALCERQPPDTNGIVPPAERRSPLNHGGERGYTVAIVPWSDHAIPIVQADRVLHAKQLEELTHAF